MLPLFLSFKTCFAVFDCSFHHHSLFLMKMNKLDEVSQRGLCAGQVITCMADVVKELLDNSIDSGGTRVEIVLTETGKSGIQVIDNGSGIKEQDFELLCLKYSTSKLSCLDDLKTVKTLGFRGEALAAICSLSCSLTILTKTKDASIGHLLTFDSSGKLVKKEPAVRASTGTTVSVKKLFHALPVRKKYLETRLKSEANKLRTVLIEYAIALPGLHVILRDQRQTGVQDILNARSVEDLKSKIALVVKTNVNSEDLELSKDILPEVSEEFDVKPEEEKLFKGHVSMTACISKTCYGKSSSDQQFMSINGRPVYIPKLNKIVNQVFRSFDSTGNTYPFFAMNFRMSNHLLDVNVTPDKKTVLIRHENVLFAMIKTSLIDLYSRNLNSRRSSKYCDSSSQVTVVGSPVKATNQVSVLRDTEAIHQVDSNQRLITDYVQSKSAAVTLNQPTSGQEYPRFTPASSLLSSSASEMTSPFKGQSVFNPGRSSSPFQSTSFSKSRGQYNAYPETSERRCHQTDRSLNTLMSRNGASMIHETMISIPGHSRRRSYSRSHSRSHSRSESPSPFHARRSESPMQNTRKETSARRLSGGDAFINKKIRREEGPAIQVHQEDHSQLVSLPDGDKKTVFRRRTLPFKLDLTRLSSTQESFQSCKSFEIQSQDENDLIQEMSRKLDKSDFSCMRVIGQFNSGFIVTQLSGDVFVVDQHAAEERRHFDHLILNNKLSGQALVSPQSMTLTPYQEHVLTDSLSIFQRNGFRFNWNKEADQGLRYSLTYVPSCQGVILGMQDALELLEMLINSPESSLMPSRVKDILAMKACKKAVKIGDALSMKDMRDILEGMSQTRSPWTCAHGRPTIRFLTNIPKTELQ